MKILEEEVVYIYNRLVEYSNENKIITSSDKLGNATFFMQTKRLLDHISQYSVEKFIEFLDILIESQENIEAKDLIKKEKLKLEKINKIFDENKYLIFTLEREEVEKTNNIIENVYDSTVLLQKPDLMLKSQWVFIKDHQFKAEITDEEFLEKVKQKKFKAEYGMKLRIRLQEIIEYDENEEIIKTTYTVLKVYDNKELEHGKLF